MAFRRRRYWLFTSLAAAIVYMAAAVLSKEKRKRRLKSDSDEPLPLNDNEISSSVLQLGVSPYITGTWVKDVQRSGALDVACDLMQLSGLVRLAVRLVKGVEIRVVPAAGSSHAEMASFNMAVFSILPWFKVRERYILSGQPSSWKRRDLRRGKHVGTAEAMSCGGVRLRLQWAAPHSGSGIDEFTLLGKNTLRVDSTIKLADGSEGAFYAVYNRK